MRDRRHLEDEPDRPAGLVGAEVLHNAAHDARHGIGAPHPEAHGGLAPAELEEAFIYASFVTNAVFWAVLGGLTALVFNWSPIGGKSSAVAT